MEGEAIVLLSRLLREGLAIGGSSDENDKFSMIHIYYYTSKRALLCYSQYLDESPSCWIMQCHYKSYQPQNISSMKRVVSPQNISVYR
eukprot:c34698_g1_i1 orf=95-358(+)